MEGWQGGITQFPTRVSDRCAYSPCLREQLLEEKKSIRKGQFPHRQPVRLAGVTPSTGGMSVAMPGAFVGD